MTAPALTVVGAGPGIGASVARCFAREGWAVGLVARSPSRLDPLVAELAAGGSTVVAEAADILDEDALRTALGTIDRRLGPSTALCFSPLPDLRHIKPVLDTAASDLRDSFALTVGGAATAVSHVLPAMREAGDGTVLITSGSAGLHPTAARAASAVTTTALGIYAALLHEALGPAGVFVHHAVVVGAVGPGEARHHPEAVAEHLYEQHLLRDTALSVLE